MARAGLAAVAATLAFGAALGGSSEARADLFKCTRGRDVWVTNYKAPGAKCSRLDIETDAPKGQHAGGWSPPTGGGASASPGRATGGGGAFARPTAGRDALPTIEPGGPRFSGDEPDDRDGREALYAAYFDEAAETFDLPEAFLRAVARVESNFRYRARSSAGAMGLMQLMPGTAGDMGVKDPWDPRSNVLGGARLLRVLADRFGGDMVKVLAAYHAGGGAVADADGIPYEATESYVRSVLDYYYQYKAAGGAIEK